MPLSIRSPRRGYLDIDEIIAACETVPCRSRVTFRPFVATSSGKHAEIRPDQDVALPLWIASALARARGTQQALISARVPKPFRDQFQDVIKADAQSIDMQSLCYHFYSVGLLCLSMPGVNEQLIRDSLMRTFESRLQAVAGSLHTTMVSTRRSRWASREEHLLAIGADAAAKMSTWFSSRRTLANDATSAASSSNRPAPPTRLPDATSESEPASKKHKSDANS